jgi:hypothetical protein
LAGNFHGEHTEETLQMMLNQPDVNRDFVFTLVASPPAVAEDGVLAVQLTLDEQQVRDFLVTLARRLGLEEALDVLSTVAIKGLVDES